MQHKRDLQRTDRNVEEEQLLCMNSMYGLAQLGEAFVGRASWQQVLPQECRREVGILDTIFRYC